MVAAFLLSAVVGWAALSAAARARLDGRAETLAAATVLASAFVLGPIYALGVAGALTRGRMAAAVVLVAIVAWGWASRGVGVRAHARETARSLGRIARMPWQGLAESWRERSAVLPCIALCLGLFLWNLAAAYLAPSWREWDALWYHEPIIGFTLQNHGFAAVDLPLGGAQKINGYPRAFEMLSLWLAAFAGRALIDMPNVLLMPAFFASVYAMARRLTGDRLASAGWAAVACTIPAYVMRLQTVYVDPAVATFVAAGAMFVLRSPPRSREMLIGAAALAIAANVKINGVFPVVALSVLAAGRILVGARGRWRKALLTVGAGASMIVALSAVSYLGNLHKFHDPLWPDLTLRVPALGIDWPGGYPNSKIVEPGFVTSKFSKNVPLPQLFRELLTRPGVIKDDEQRHSDMYGLGVVWVLIPAAVLVFAAIARALLPVRRRAMDAAERARFFEVLALVAASGFMLVTSTNRATPRYQLATIAMWVPVVGWALGRRRALHEAMAFAAVIGSLAILAWEMPDWRAFPGPRAMVSLLELDPPLREMTPELGAPVRRETSLAREAELVAGTTVVTDDFVFPAVLWNNAYTNRVVSVRSGADLAAEADRLGATWIYVADAGRANAKRLRANPRWSEIGPLYVEGWGSAFRRKR